MNLAAPTEVAAVQVVESGQYTEAIRVTWKLVGLAVYYLVYRSEQPDGVFEYVSEVKENILNSYLDTKVEAGHTYYYKIRAGSSQANVNASGFSNASAGVTVRAGYVSALTAR
jgi:fibronectin type 3 domain-containing protein